MLSFSKLVEAKTETKKAIDKINGDDSVGRIKCREWVTMVKNDKLKWKMTT